MSLKEKIEESRNELHIILASGISEVNEILKLSQQLDTLIVEYQKNLLSSSLVCA